MAWMARVGPFLWLVAFLAAVPMSTSGAETADPAGTDAIPTLDDIIIEGELVVPQVLFITARDQHRYMDFMYTAYLSSSLELAEVTVLPMWIGLAPAPLAVHAAGADGTTNDEKHDGDANASASTE